MKQPWTAWLKIAHAALPPLATVGTWSTPRPLRYLDLVDVDVTSIFDMVGNRPTS